MEQPCPRQLQNRSLDRVTGGEVVRDVGHLAHELVERQLDGMQIEDVAEDGSLDSVCAQPPASRRAGAREVFAHRGLLR
jgi:hypothetical protein